jgi:hypothetical protein
MMVGSAFASTLNPDRPPSPSIEHDGTIKELDARIRREMKDPDSVIYESFGFPVEGVTPGGAKTWIVTVVLRAKNSYGAYTGNKTEKYYYDPRLKMWFVDTRRSRSY